ncbi:hypothetical protein LCGC14_0514870 [marine sediment metagenome]|uniref:Uncharacterized protein n=1 Tax=marine sediment metagenome TaxID=412755 RepID=A0A0F9ULK8_9ZZZZ
MILTYYCEKCGKLFIKEPDENGEILRIPYCDSCRSN